MKTKSLVGILVLIFIAILVLTVMGTLYVSDNSYRSSIPSNNPSPTGYAVSSTPKCRTEQVPYTKTEYYTETVPYTKQVCDEKEIPYSITNVKVTKNICHDWRQLCKDTDWFGNPIDCTKYCIIRYVGCSGDLKNLDNEEEGEWRIGFKFYGSGDLIGHWLLNPELLYPQTSKNLFTYHLIESDGIEGDANKEYVTCEVYAHTAPTKQVCRDVIKYKEVQKTREVKDYRIEEVCE